MSSTRSTTRRTVRRGLAAAALLALAACSPGAGSPGGSGSAASSTDDGTAAADPSTLRVLAGSEVKDMQPILDEAATATGVKVVLSYAGTLDGAEQVASGAAARSYDATWFSSNRYLGLLPGGNAAVTNPTRIMASPVILGVKESKAKALGWDTKAPTWAEISAAVGAKKLTYGMTNPASSNSGFSALVGVATALAGGGSAIDAQRIAAVKPQLTQFFSGQKLTSGSSGWLAERYKSGQTPVDGLVNYESVLLDLDATGGLAERLTLVYPRDGVVSADYPLSLLAGATAKQDAFRRLTDWLRTPDAQRAIMERTHRRPVVPGVKPAAEFGNHLLVELPFPAQRSAADGLVATYLDEVRRPSQTVYVLDTSGSMSGERSQQLKAAFATLSGRDAQGADAFATFRRRERVAIIPFSSTARQPVVFEVPEKAPETELARIGSTVDALGTDGGTALYSALVAGYDEAARLVASRPDTFTSIVLMTDGEKTEGMSANDFLSRYRALPAQVRAVPTFTVLFGDSSPAELGEIAKATGGKVFDSRTTPLARVFKEIRGYQ